MDERLKHLFETELAHLKSRADQFARQQRYRRLAGRMGLDPNAELRDPFVDWMVQGYAFLAARIQHRLEAEFPRFTQNLLSVVHPPLASPTPSMIVAGFEMRREPGLMTGPVVPRGYRLMLPTEIEGRRRRVRNVTYTTGRQLRLFPVEVTEATYLPDRATLEAAGAEGDAPAGIAMTLSLTVDAGLQDLPSDTLDLHLSNADGMGAQLFEAMALSGARVEAHGTVKRRGKGAAARMVEVAPLGLERERTSQTGGREIDMLLPYDQRSFDGFRLLHEFFSLPDRFHFLRLSGLEAAFAGRAERAVRLIFLLPRAFPGLAGKLGRDAIRPNCVPAVNLFEHDADDIPMTMRQVEHQIIADRGNPASYEVHSVLSVTGRSETGQDQVFRPFFAVGGLGERLDGPQRYYALHRRPREEPSTAETSDPALKDYRGTEVFLSLVDDAARPISRSLRALGLRVLCTNRHLPLYAKDTLASGELKAGTDLGFETIRIVAGPSDPRPGLPEGRALWDAISHLTLNYLSLTEGEGPIPAAPLRQMLRLYVPDSPPLAGQIADSVRGVRTGPAVRRLAAPPTASGRIAPVSFVRGLEIALTLDNNPPQVTTLAAILDRFFAGYVGANTFTETILYRPDGVERLRWKAKSGSKTTL